LLVILSVLPVAFTVPMALVMSLAMSVAAVIIMMLATILVIALAAVSAMTLAVTRHVLSVVPVILDEVDWLATRVVPMAVFAPMLLVAWRDVHVDRLAYLVHCHGLDHYRLLIDNSRLRDVADINPAVEAGLAHAHRYADIGGKGGGTNCGQCSHA
jgi:hypothetical protein